MKFRTFKKRYRRRQRLALLQLKRMGFFSHQRDQRSLSQHERDLFHHADRLMMAVWDTFPDQRRIEQYTRRENYAGLSTV